MTTRNRTFMTLAVVAMATLVFTATSAQAAVLTQTFTVVDRLSNFNLTTEGPMDWNLWRLDKVDSTTPSDQKAGGTAIGTLNKIGTLPLDDYAWNSLNFDWTDGDPNATGDDVDGGMGIHNYSTGYGFSFTVPAPLTESTLKVYAFSYDASMTTTATLSDGSAGPVSLVGRNYGVYELTFAAGAPGQTLTVETTITALHGGNAFLNYHAIALDAVPEPATMALLGLGGLGLILGRKRR